MKRIEISILKPSAALQAFTQTWQDAQMEEAVTPRLVFGSFGEFFAENYGDTLLFTPFPSRELR